MINSCKGVKAVKTKNRIVQAAKKHFIEKGYKSSIMQDIAEEVSIDRRTIYRYFESKDALISCIMADLYKDYLLYINSINFDECGKAIDKIEKYFNANYIFLVENPSLIKIISIFDFKAIKPSSSNEDIDKQFSCKYTSKCNNRYIDNKTHEVDKRLRDFIIEGLEDGSVETTYDPELVACSINTSIIALVTRVTIYSKHITICTDNQQEDICKIQFNIFLDALRKKSHNK